MLHVVGQCESAAMQVGVVVARLDAQFFPFPCLEILDRVKAVGREAEQPVAGRVGRDMGLVDPADLERLDDALVRPLHGDGVHVVEGALVLVDQDAVRVQRLVAVAVELAREQTLAGPEGVGRVDDDQVVVAFVTADKLEPVLDVDRDARVVQPAGCERQVGAAGLDHHLVDLDQVDALDRLVAGQLTHDAAVAGADDQDAADLGVDRQRHVGQHLVVDELVLLGQHQEPVQNQHTAELLGLEDVDALEFALRAVKLAVDLDRQLDMRRMLFRKPQFHNVSHSISR